MPSLVSSMGIWVSRVGGMVLASIRHCSVGLDSLLFTYLLASTPLVGILLLVMFFLLFLYILDGVFLLFGLR